MLLLRSEVYRMITFMLSIMPTEEKTAMNCLFVRIKGDKFIFITSGAHSVKMDSLTTQSTIPGTTKNKKELPETFMIPRGDLKAFCEILKDHKSITKKLPKGDETRLYVEIDNESMSSVGSVVDFKQPKFMYKENQHYFEQETESVIESFMIPGEISSLMTGFSNSEPVIATHCVMTAGKEIIKLIKYKQEETGLEAVFICPSEVAKEEKGKDEQKTF